MGEATQSTERRVFVGGMPFGYEVTSPPTQHKPWHRDSAEVLWHAIVWQLRAAPRQSASSCSKQPIHATPVWYWCHSGTDDETQRLNWPACLPGG